MSTELLHNTNLELLQSSDEINLLDTVDELRSQGVSHYLSLPQLIVCGDQSSGKSSVLEAISGIPFPTKDNLCTRFATELILRRTRTIEVRISIVPGHALSDTESKRLSGFSETLADFNELPALNDRAREFMGLSAVSSAFCDDVLRVEVSGPDQQHLTIVDLPGLIHAENKLQTAADVSLVLSMVKSYMANARSIILAVVSAKNDYANQIVTKLSKDVDPKGYRTLGIITKPDTLSAGSESEAAYTNLARNREVEFRLGWHVLRNRDYETRNTTLHARDAAEEQFFSHGIWQDFPRQSVGIASLRLRLSKVLLQQIRSELPALVTELEATVDEVQESLVKMGDSRTTVDDQRLFLLHISQSFQSLVKAAVDGTYGHIFFGDTRTAEGYSKRFRAVVQNLNLDFAETMRIRGNRRKIVDHNNLPVREVPPSNQEPDVIDRGRFLDEITRLLKRSRGRELPGMFNPLIIGDLFHEQSAPWMSLIRRHLNGVWEAARAFLELVISYLADEHTAEVLLREVIDSLMNERAHEMEEKLQELLAPHQKGHPITYNHYLTETIQNMREKRMEDEVIRRLSKVYGRKDLATLDELPTKKIRTSTLISALSSRNEADMDLYASSEVLDCMQAYYKVTMKSVIDNIAIQVVEVLLVNHLEDLFSPSRVMQMKPDQITRIAKESPESCTTRDELVRKLEILRNGIKTCKRSVARPTTNLQDRPWRSNISAVSEDDFEEEIQDMGTLRMDDGDDDEVRLPVSVESNFELEFPTQKEQPMQVFPFDQPTAPATPKSTKPKKAKKGVQDVK